MDVANPTIEQARVIVTKPMLNLADAGLWAICYMQVCAVKDATDNEILETCNRENVAGTTNGWTTVIRQDTERMQGAVPCADDSGRQHLMVGC